MQLKCSYTNTGSTGYKWGLTLNASEGAKSKPCVLEQDTRNDYNTLCYSPGFKQIGSGYLSQALKVNANSSNFLNQDRNFK